MFKVLLDTKTRQQKNWYRYVQHFYGMIRRTFPLR